MKNEMLRYKNGENLADSEGGLMKNDMPSLPLDERICFIRLPPGTLQNFWQVISHYIYPPSVLTQ
jgi:hypothetical protein